MSESTPNDASPGPRIAPHPFDRSITDIILRTTDHVDFHVFSQVLIAASPVFEEMLYLPQSSTPGQAQLNYGKPIIRIGEDSTTLSILLHICYPVIQQDVKTLEELEPALHAAMEFEMELAIMVLTKRLEKLACKFPLKAWAVACRLRLEPIARLAAERLSLTKLKHNTIHLLAGVTAGDYFRLREYLRLTQLKVPKPKDYRFLSCLPCGKSTDSLTPSSASSNPLIFVDTPTPDIVCQSSDDIDFHVHKSALSLSSPVFQQEISSTKDEATGFVIRLEEPSHILSPLLQLCYANLRGAVVFPSDPFHLMSFLLALQKYQMVSALAAVRGAWHAAAASDPLRAYCAAIRADDADCTRDAALCVLEMEFEGVFVPEMELMPAVSYHRLLTYRYACRSVAADHSTRIEHALTSPARESPSDSLPSPVSATREPASNAVEIITLASREISVHPWGENSVPRESRSR